ncbi:MAG: serine/threonine protein kinase [Lachnospiraceae bacterium]|nr:serine/threonine protein kinase [Lachnospiraceae bacterium]
MIEILLANRYRVLKKLGTGGMANVYLVRDSKLGMLWAVKELGDSGEFTNYTRKAEVSVLRRVSHPNLPRVTDIFDENKKTYMVMDYIEGKSLREILDTGKKIPPGQFYKWSLQITSALFYLHSMNPPVIYRDLKPSNIMIRPSGDAVLIDFGTAKKSGGQKDEFALGTAGYAAPEQYEGISGKRSDIFSLGRVLSDMSGSDATLFLRHIIKKCTAADPKKRYRSVESVRHALIISRDIYKYAIALTTVIIIAGIGIYKSGENARDSVREIKELNESERVNASYENALMCFYELRDYPAARSYFEKADGDRIPESSYYVRLCDVLLDPGRDRDEMFEVIEEFEGFNEREVKKADPSRKAKNDLRIARIYLAFSDGDQKRLQRARAILEGTDPGDESINSDALLLLEAVYRELGRISEKEKWFQKAIECNDRLISLADQQKDEEAAAKRYLSSARLYEELSMYKKADGCYRSSKENFPGVCPEIYTGHLRLLISKGASGERIRQAYREALSVEGMQNNREFVKLKERMKDE